MAPSATQTNKKLRTASPAPLKSQKTSKSIASGTESGEDSVTDHEQSRKQEPKPTKPALAVAKPKAEQAQQSSAARGCWCRVAAAVVVTLVAACFGAAFQQRCPFQALARLGALDRTGCMVGKMTAAALAAGSFSFVARKVWSGKRVLAGGAAMQKMA